MKRILLLAALLSTVLSGHVTAQEPALPAPGARIRVRVPTVYRQRWIVGTVESVDSSTLVLRRESEGGVYALPLVAIDRIDISRGMVGGTSGASLRAKQGVLAGLGVGAVGVAFSYIFPSGADEDDTKRTMLMGGLALGAAGGLIGAVMGSQDAERWEPLSTSGFRLSVRRDPSTGGVSIALRL